MTDAGPPPPDTSEMLVIHSILRDAIASAPRLVGGVADGDTARAEVIAGYYDEVLHILHLHHEGEDVLVWPKLLERATAHAELIQTNAAQHRDIDEPASRVEKTLTDWRSAPSTASGEALVTAIGDLGQKLLPHLDNEEANILPLIGEHLTAPEWGELPAHAMKNYAGERVFLVLGLVREAMNQEQRDRMLAHMPPPAVEMWQTKGEAAFNAYMADVRA